MRNHSLQQAISNLAALFEFGALKASTAPAEFMDDARKEILCLRAELAALRAERDRLDAALRQIGKHPDSCGDDCVSELARLDALDRAERAEAEAAGLRADAERWRAVSAMMTHEHRGDAVGWTLSVLLPGDDPDAAIDAARAGGE